MNKFFRWLARRIKEEPAAISAIINVVLVQAIAYGFDISADQLANWNMLIALVLGFATRQSVVSTGVSTERIQTAVKMPEDSTVREVINEADRIKEAKGE
jgi:hypothetical protein